MKKKNKKPKFVLVIKSDDLDTTALEKIKKEFKKGLKNGRVPIFGISPHESIEIIKIPE